MIKIIFRWRHRMALRRMGAVRTRASKTDAQQIVDPAARLFRRQVRIG